MKQAFSSIGKSVAAVKESEAVDIWRWCIFSLQEKEVAQRDKDKARQTRKKKNEIWYKRKANKERALKEMKEAEEELENVKTETNSFNLVHELYESASTSQHQMFEQRSFKASDLSWMILDGPICPRIYYIGL